MRSIDRFAGIPLCWLVGLLLKIYHPKSDGKPISEWNTILVIKFFGMGSLLLSTPFLAGLRRHRPNARIVYLTFAGNQELLDRLTEPDLKLTISTTSAQSFLVDSFRLIRTLRRLHIDAVFDLEFFSKFSTLISSLSVAPIRVGFSLPTIWRKINLTHPVPLENSAHATSLFLHQLSEFGIGENRIAPLTMLNSSPAERESMQQKLRLRTEDSTVITININAGQTSLERRWSPDRFIEVAAQLKEAMGAVRFFFTGTAQEFGYVDDALDRKPSLRSHSMNSAGLLTLGELIALFERTSVFLTNDSGPLHIAVSVGTPVVALFGPESPQLYGPLGTSRIIYKNIACSPCLNVYNAKLFVCPYDAKCMKEISTGEVLAAVRSLLPELQPEHA